MLAPLSNYWGADPPLLTPMRVHALYFDKYLLYLVEIIAVFFCMGIVTLFD